MVNFVEHDPYLTPLLNTFDKNIEGNGPMSNFCRKQVEFNRINKKQSVLVKIKRDNIWNEELL